MPNHQMPSHQMPTPKPSDDMRSPRKFKLVEILTYLCTYIPGRNPRNPRIPCHLMYPSGDDGAVYHLVS